MPRSASSTTAMATPRPRAASARAGGSPFGGFGGFGDISDIFDEFFGGGMGARGNRQRGPARGNDLRYDLEITFQEAVFGAEKESKCRGWKPARTATAAAPSRAPRPSAARSATARARSAARSRRSWASSST